MSDAFDPMVYIVHGIIQARILKWGPGLGSLSNPGIKPWSPALQADSSPAEPQGSTRILEWVAYHFSSRSSQPRNWTGVSCITARFFTNWAIREAQFLCHCVHSGPLQHPFGSVFLKNPNSLSGIFWGLDIIYARLDSLPSEPTGRLDIMYVRNHSINDSNY